MERSVLVFGATGKTGIQICDELKTAAVPYDVVVREGSVDRLVPGHRKLWTGDVLSAMEVRKTLEAGQWSDVVIALGSRDLKAGMIRSGGTRIILEGLAARKAAPVIHVISALGTNESRTQMRWFEKLFADLLLRAAMKDHQEQERLVRDSGLDSHIIRPVGLKDGDALGRVHVQDQGHLPSSSIRRADVARFTVESLLQGRTGASSICQAV